MMRIGSLFSGIGGLELGLERAGLGHVVWQVEIDPYCRDVLARHWPSATRYPDVREVSEANLAPVDALCGGFPCQDVSLAGRRAGLDGARSGLWREYARLIAELAPALVVIENVIGLRTAGLREVLADLAALGFDAEWSTFSALEAGAPHQRDRLWIIAAHPDRVQLRHEPGWLSRACGAVTAVTRQHLAGLLASDADGSRRLERARELATIGRWPEHCGWDFDPAARVDDGLPRGMVGRRRKALGNAVVVRCAEAIGGAVVDAMREAA